MEKPRIAHTDFRGQISFRYAGDVCAIEFVAAKADFAAMVRSAWKYALAIFPVTGRADFVYQTCAERKQGVVRDQKAIDKFVASRTSLDLYRNLYSLYFVLPSKKWEKLSNTEDNLQLLSTDKALHEDIGAAIKAFIEYTSSADQAQALKDWTEDLRDMVSFCESQGRLLKTGFLATALSTRESS